MDNIVGQIYHCPAKLNLALHVVGRSDCGYHYLESLACFTNRGDELAVTIPASAEGKSDLVMVTGPFATGLEKHKRNLVLQAADALRRYAYRHGTGHVDCPPAVFFLSKNLPVASGLGGGSSDAAMAVKLLNRVWNLNYSVSVLQEIALSLGTDIPMFFAEDSLLVARHLGEVTSAIPLSSSLYVLMVNPLIPVLTADIFQSCRPPYQKGLPAIPEHGWESVGEFLQWLRGTGNSLQDIAIGLYPEISDVLSILNSGDALCEARMSGSGATCFVLYDCPEKAEKDAQRIRDCYENWWVYVDQIGFPVSGLMDNKAL